MGIAEIRELGTLDYSNCLSVARPEIRGDKTRQDLSLKESLIWKMLGDGLNLIEYFACHD